MLPEKNNRTANHVMMYEIRLSIPAFSVCDVGCCHYICILCTPFLNVISVIYIAGMRHYSGNRMFHCFINSRSSLCVVSA